MRGYARPRRSDLPTGSPRRRAPPTVIRGGYLQSATVEPRRTRGLRNPRARQRALAIGAVPQAPPADGEDPLAELKELLRTAGVATADELVQVRAAPDPDRYFGRGKLAELKARSSARAPTWSPATTSSRRARSATSRRRSTSR